MIRNVLHDERGGVIVENVITMWVFLLLTLGITQAGLIMWSAVGIQHGVQMAARCASVSDAAIVAGLNPATNPHALLQHEHQRRFEQRVNREDICGEQFVGRGRALLKIFRCRGRVRDGLECRFRAFGQCLPAVADELPVPRSSIRAAVVLCDDV